MSTMKTSSVLFILLFLPVFAFAEIQEMKVGDVGVSYDEIVEADTNGNGMNDRSSFYKNGALVFTAYDRDEDGKPDLWFQYDDELFLTQSLEDVDSDGTPDEVLGYSREEEITRVKNRNDKSSSLYLLVIGVVIAGFIIVIFRKKMMTLIRA